MRARVCASRLFREPTRAPAHASLPLLFFCSIWNVAIIAGVSFALLRNAQAHDALLAMSESGWYGFIRLTVTVTAAVICAVVNWHMLRRVQMLVYPLPGKSMPEHASSTDSAGNVAQKALGWAAFFASKEARKGTVQTLKSAYELPAGTADSQMMPRAVSAGTAEIPAR